MLDCNQVKNTKIFILLRSSQENIESSSYNCVEKLFFVQDMCSLICRTSLLQVVAAEKESKEGLQEKLNMTVAVPLLWGVPPASDTLRFAVRSGGGVVEKVYWQWDFL